jgi:Leucine Rich repeat
LTTNSTLQELILSRNDIGEQGLTTLGPALVGLQNISLAECGLSGVEAAGIVSTLLIMSSTLQVLRLEENDLLDAAFISAMSPGLGSTTSLVELHLRGCPLQSEGIATLFKSLPKQLAHLDISGSGAGPEGLTGAAAALAERSRNGGGAQPSLHRLVACGCGGDDPSLAALINSLAKGYKDIEVDLSGNTAGKLTISAILCNSHLRAVCLHDCKLGSDGGDALSSQILGADNTETDGNDDNNGNQHVILPNLIDLDISANGLESPQLINILNALQTTADTCCPNLKQLVIAANPGAMEGSVTEAIEHLQAVRTGLDVVRRSADTGERDGQSNNN